MRPCVLSRSVGLVGGALAGLEAGRRRVVLDDVVVPVDHPDVAVGPDLGHDRARSTRRRWPAGSRRCASGSRLPSRLEHERGDQVAGRLGDEGGAVPVFLRIGAGGVEGVAGRGGEAAVLVDLADLVGDRVEAVRCRRCRRAPRDDQPRTAS